MSILNIYVSYVCIPLAQCIKHWLLFYLLVNYHKFVYKSICYLFLSIKMYLNDPETWLLLVKSKRSAWKSTWLHESHLIFKWIQLNTGMQFDDFQRPMMNHIIWICTFKMKSREGERDTEHQRRPEYELREGVLHAHVHKKPFESNGMNGRSKNPHTQSTNNNNHKTTPTIYGSW